MRNLKRVAWVCFASCCCCAGLMLLAGERSAGTITTYCPVVFEGQFNGSYLYGCYVRGADCMAPQMYFMGDYRLHETGPCGTCPDPIATAGHPLPADLPEPSLVPQADPRFSGILR